MQEPLSKTIMISALVHPMRRVLHNIGLLMSGIVSLFALSSLGLAEPESSGDGVAVAGRPLVIELGEYAFVTRGQGEYLESAMIDAEAAGASALVLRINCSGGLASASRRFVEKAASLKIPVVAWVEGDSAGAGALAALAADKIYFAKDVRFGGEVDEIEWRGPKKEIPSRLADLRYSEIGDELVEALKGKGRSELVVRGISDPEIEVVLEGKKYSDAGDVLEFDQRSAEAAGIVAGGAADLSEVLAAAAIEGEAVVRRAPEVVIRRPIKVEPPVADQVGDEVGDEVGEGNPESETPTVGGPVVAAPAEEEEVPFGATKQESFAGKIVVIKVGDETLSRPTKFEYMQRIIEKAEEDGAEAIIFDMDTPGGLLFGTIKQMLTHLQNLEVPTYTFINPWAISAGSMIAISTDYIYMQTPSTIGSSAVVTSGGGEIEGAMYEKVVRAFLAAALDVATIKGRDYDLIKAFVEIDAEYKATVPLVTAEGSLGELVVLENNAEELLALSSTEANQLVDGKPLFGDGTARSLEELIDKAGLKGEVIRAKPLGFEAVADWIVKLAPWLLLFGIAGAYMEMKMPGFGVPGFISLICFGLFFFGHKAAGYMAGYEAVGLFLLGVILVVIEFFVFPGLFVFAISGFLLIFGTLIYAMIDPINRNFDGKLDFEGLGAALVGPAMNLVVAVIGAGVLIVILLRYLPSTPMMRWLILDAGLGKGTGLKFAGGMDIADGGDQGELTLVGRTGTAETDLRPAGAARFGEDRIDVVSTGDFIETGAAVRIVEHEGSRVAVEEV